MMDYAQLEEAAAFVQSRLPDMRPAAGMILGSGWSDVADAFDVITALDYADIPGLGAPGVAGHSGRLVAVRLDELDILIFQGRRHWYEGRGWTPVALPVYVMKELGVQTLLLTNAAGGIRRDLIPGSLMVIRDHIHMMGDHPLIGPHQACWGPRFPDQTHVYNPGLAALLHRAAKRAGLVLAEGVYLAGSGPSYETPAEIGAYTALGADAVGMSTTPEAMLAHAAGLRVVGLSCITNCAAGILDQPLTHEEVTQTTREVMPKMSALIQAFWREVNRESR